jgi:hypothetical protein
LYFADREDEAEHYYAYLRTHYGFTEAEGQLDEVTRCRSAISC